MRHSSSLLAVLAAIPLTAGLVACGGSGSSGGTVATDCKPAHQFPTTQQGKLLVSTYVSPPYTEQQGTTFTGIDSEIIQQIAKMECLNPQQNAIAGAALIASVQSNRADLAIGGVYRTPERAQLLELTDTMYRDGMALLSKQDVKTVADLTGKTVGVIQGYLWNAELQALLGQDSVKIYQASDGMLTDLANGRLDVGVLTTAEAAYRIKQTPAAGLKANDITPDQRIKSSLAPGEVVLPHTKGNTAMTTALNEDIKTLVSNGTIARILTENGMPNPSPEAAS